MKLRFICALLAAAGLAGCATPTMTTDQASSVTSNRASQAIEAFQKSKPMGVVREVDEPSVDFTRTEAPRIRGDVNVKAAAAPFAPILSEIAKKAGYSVAFGDMVDMNRKVTIDYTDAVTEDAIRTTAFLAGYAAVLDKANHTVYVSDVATYTFRLPAGVFSALQAQYTVGGNPANAGSSSGGASGGGGSSGGTSLKADFNITGREGSSPQGLTKFLQDLAGKNADVIVTDNGIVNVRANAQSLKRVHDFMKSFANDAMTQVEIEASVVEVGLSNDFSLGIQWGKVVDRATSTGGAVLGGTGAVSQAMTASSPASAFSTLVNGAGSTGMGAFRVGASTTSLINALAQFTDVNVVSQPRLLSMNNVPATFFDGTQIPYLGSVQQTQGTGANTQPTTTGTVAFAIDGVSFSAIPSVVDGKTVQITLIPVLSNVQGMSDFLNGTLSAPKQSNKQTFMRVLAENNKTLILGGIRYSKDTKSTSVATSTSKSSSTKEIVILLRANVVAPPAFDPIVSESL
jgi:MSHA biogenesis protein MshL